MVYDYKFKPCGKVKAETLPFSPGKNINPNGTDGPLTAKVPVVLAEKEVQIDVEACIDIKDDFFEIKRVKKNVFLTQCKLLPNAGQKDCDGRLISGKLFIKGFVEKNIEYATIEECEYADVKNGLIKHATAKVPFQTVTEVFFDKPPVFKFRSRVKEFDYFTKDCHKKEECDETLGKLLCETGFEEEVFYLERPFCELEGARIIELDTVKEDVYYHADQGPSPYEDKEKCYEDKEKDYENKFGRLIEKMVVYLRIKVLQDQQVNIR
ncbi:CsxC family protein [Clostridium polynesiense]|uniref:CsxC family protein n=1 Tax=Clostridium polynesiense TaxID=1325933 RepID=UPI0006942264|nr:hypothetical protein [Clostridium polynesiense]